MFILLASFSSFGQSNDLVSSDNVINGSISENLSGLDNGNYKVIYENGIIRSKIWLDNNGNPVLTHRYITESSLSPFILAKIQMNYKSRKVFGLTEVSSEAAIFYYIILEDEKKLYARTSNTSGELTLKKIYSKA